MSETRLSNFEQAIIKLVELTQDGKLKWEIVNSKEYLPNADIDGPLLIAKYNETYLLLYKIAYSGPSNLLSASLGIEEKGYRPELGVYDMSVKVKVYSFPYTKPTNDLYRSATYNASKIDELISQILDENS